MKISSTKLTTPFTRSTPTSKRTEIPECTPNDTFSFGYRSRRSKRKLIKRGIVLAGTAVGAFALAKYTGDFTGLAAKVAGGVGGAAAGAVILGVSGMAIAGRDEGLGGLARGAAGAAIGGIVGAVVGGIGGSMIGVGAGNALSYVAGGLGGAIVGGFTAKGAYS